MLLLLHFSGSKVLHSQTYLNIRKCIKTNTKDKYIRIKITQFYLLFNSSDFFFLFILNWRDVCSLGQSFWELISYVNSLSLTLIIVITRSLALMKSNLRNYGGINDWRGLVEDLTIYLQLQCMISIDKDSFLDLHKLKSLMM